MAEYVLGVGLRGERQIRPFSVFRVWFVVFQV